MMGWTERVFGELLIMAVIPRHFISRHTHVFLRRTGNLVQDSAHLTDQARA